MLVGAVRVLIQAAKLRHVSACRGCQSAIPDLESACSVKVVKVHVEVMTDDS